MHNLSQHLKQFPQYITNDQLCEILKISPSTLRRRKEPSDPGYDPNFPVTHYFGKRLPRYELADVLRYLKNS